MIIFFVLVLKTKHNRKYPIDGDFLLFWIFTPILQCLTKCALMFVNNNFKGLFIFFQSAFVNLHYILGKRPTLVKRALILAELSSPQCLPFYARLSLGPKSWMRGKLSILLPSSKPKDIEGHFMLHCIYPIHNTYTVGCLEKKMSHIVHLKLLYRQLFMYIYSYFWTSYLISKWISNHRLINKNPHMFEWVTYIHILVYFI